MLTIPYHSAIDAMKYSFQQLVTVLVTEEALAGRSRRYQLLTSLVILGTICFATGWTLSKLM